MGEMGKGGIELRAHNGFLPHMGIPSNGPFVGAGIINRPPVFALRGKKRYLSPFVFVEIMFVLLRLWPVRFVPRTGRVAICFPLI